MCLLMALRFSTGMLGMVGTWTKFRYQSRPIHSTPLMTCSQRMAKVAQAWSILVHWPVTAPMMTMMTMSRTTPAPTVRPGDVKIAPMIESPYLVEGTTNPINLLYYLQAPRSTAAGTLFRMASSYSAPEAAHDYVFQEVRQADRDRFLAALFAPEPQRTGLLALLAFDHELARTGAVTREPMLARIRLEWWRDAVGEAAGDGKPRAQPVVESLSETVRRHALPLQRMIDLIDAREEEIEGALDVIRAGHALADLQLAVLGVADAPTRQAARAVAAAGLMGEGPERAA